MFDQIYKWIDNAKNSFKNFFTGLFKQGEVKGRTDVVEKPDEKPEQKTEKEPEEIDVTEGLSVGELIKCMSEQKIPEEIIDLANEVVDDRNGSATLEVNEDISLILIRNEKDGIDIYNSNSLEKPFAELSEDGELNIKDYDVANQLFGELDYGIISDLKDVEVSNGPDLNAMLNGQGQER